MNRRVFLAAFSALLPLATAVALAQPPEPGPPGPPPDVRLEKQLERLGLEPGQMEKVGAVLGASKQKREEIRSQLDAAFDQMHSLLEQEPPDETAIMKQVEKIGAIKTEGHKAMLHTLLQVRAALTPEQREKLKKMNRRDRPPWRRWPWRRDRNRE